MSLEHLLLSRYPTLSLSLDTTTRKLLHKTTTLSKVEQKDGTDCADAVELVGREQI